MPLMGSGMALLPFLGGAVIVLHWWCTVGVLIVESTGRPWHKAATGITRDQMMVGMMVATVEYEKTKI